MKLLLTKEYLDRFDLKQVSRAVMKLFEDYNYKIYVSKHYKVNRSYFKGESSISLKNYRSNSVLEEVINREQILEYINSFKYKIRTLKYSFTEEENTVFKYSVQEKMPDKELCDELAKSYKKVKLIKKSCYVKIALEFGLVNPKDNTIYKTISLID